MDESLNKLIRANRSLIKKLLLKRTEVVSHQTGCLIAKTAGTTANTVGTTIALLGVLGAPFTAGASLAFTLGGLGFTAAGVTTNIVTNVVDSKCAQAFVKEIETILSERDDTIRELGVHFEQLGKLVEVARQAGMTEEEAMGFALRYGLSYSMTTLRIIKPETMTEMAGVGTKAMKTLPKVVYGLEPAMANLGIKPAALVNLSGKVVGGIAKGLAAVGVVLQAWEVISLVKEWNTKHPTVDAIDKLLEQLEKETEEQEALLKTLKDIDSELVTLLVTLQPDELLAPLVISTVELKNNSTLIVLLDEYRLEPGEFEDVVKQSRLYNQLNAEELYILTEDFIRYAFLSSYFFTEGSKVSVELNISDSKKMKETILTGLTNLLQHISSLREVKGKDSKDTKMISENASEKCAQATRAYNVINNDVLKLYQDIILDFVGENLELSATSVTIYEDIGQLRQACVNYYNKIYSGKNSQLHLQNDHEPNYGQEPICDNDLNNDTNKLRHIIIDVLRENPQFTNTYDHLFANNSRILLDLLDPLGNFNCFKQNPGMNQSAYIAIENMVVFFAENCSPHSNVIECGRIVQQLRQASVNHMNEMFRSKTKLSYQDTQFTAIIKTLVDRMNSFEGDGPMFVDEQAKNEWLASCRCFSDQLQIRHQQYDMVCTRIKEMFEKLYDKLEHWVLEFQQV